LPPALQGCYTQGDSYEKVLFNIEDAIRLHIEDSLDEEILNQTIKEIKYHKQRYF
jgi:predicted RNase H-like HicB family nuclease